MGKDDRLRKAELAGYGLLSGDDGKEIWGRLELPSTLEFDGREWVLYRRTLISTLRAMRYLAMPASIRPVPSRP